VVGGPHIFFVVLFSFFFSALNLYGQRAIIVCVCRRRRNDLESGVHASGMHCCTCLCRVRGKAELIHRIFFWAMMVAVIPKQKERQRFIRFSNNQTRINRTAIPNVVILPDTSGSNNNFPLMQISCPSRSARDSHNGWRTWIPPVLPLFFRNPISIIRLPCSGILFLR